MARLADRFEANVDRSGDHDVWTGSKKADGTGKRSTGARSRRHGSRGSSPTGRCQRERRSSRAPTSGPASASTPLPAPAGHGRRPDTAAAGAEGSGCSGVAYAPRHCGTGALLDPAGAAPDQEVSEGTRQASGACLMVESESFDEIAATALDVMVEKVEGLRRLTLGSNGGGVVRGHPASCVRQVLRHCEVRVRRAWGHGAVLRAGHASRDRRGHHRPSHAEGCRGAAARRDPKGCDSIPARGRRSTTPDTPSVRRDKGATWA
jgi:hypothetical protein